VALDNDESRWNIQAVEMSVVDIKECKGAISSRNRYCNLSMSMLSKADVDINVNELPAVVVY